MKDHKTGLFLSTQRAMSGKVEKGSIFDQNIKTRTPKLEFNSINPDVYTERINSLEVLMEVTEKFSAIKINSLFRLQNTPCEAKHQKFSCQLISPGNTYVAVVINNQLKQQIKKILAGHAISENESSKVVWHIYHTLLGIKTSGRTEYIEVKGEMVDKATPRGAGSQNGKTRRDFIDELIIQKRERFSTMGRKKFIKLMTNDLMVESKTRKDKFDKLLFKKPLSQRAARDNVDNSIKRLISAKIITI